MRCEKRPRPIGENASSFRTETMQGPVRFPDVLKGKWHSRRRSNWGQEIETDQNRLNIARSLGRRIAEWAGRLISHLHLGADRAGRAVSHGA
jgi:hypothetical protein